MKTASKSIIKIVLVIVIVQLLLGLLPKQIDFTLSLPTKIHPSDNQIIDLKSQRRFVPLTSDNEIFVYSAYWDRSMHVRIFLLRKYNAFRRILCSVTPQQNQTPTEWRTTNNCHGRRFVISNLLQYYEYYVGSFICCDANLKHISNLFHSNLSVSLFAQGESHTVTIPIGIGLADTKTNFKHKFGLCVAPWYQSSQYNLEFLIEYIELHKLMGVQLLNIYWIDLPSVSVQRFLASLTNSSDFKITLIPWMLPIPNPKKHLFYYAQILAYNDCLYRLSYQSQYVLFMDFDELLVPHRTLGNHTEQLPNWSSITKHLNNGQLSQYRTVCFRVVYFPSWNDESYIYARMHSTDQSFKQRRKCIVKSGLVNEMGVHEPIEPSKWGWGSNYGQVFHFRNCVLNWDQPCPKNVIYVRNEALQPYRKLVQQNVQKILTQIGSI